MSITSKEGEYMMLKLLLWLGFFFVAYNLRESLVDTLTSPQIMFVGVLILLFVMFKYDVKGAYNIT